MEAKSEVGDTKKETGSHSLEIQILKAPSTSQIRSTGGAKTEAWDESLCKRHPLDHLYHGPCLTQSSEYLSIFQNRGVLCGEAKPEGCLSGGTILKTGGLHK